MTDAQGEVSAALGDGERAARERLWRRVEVDPVTLQVIGGAFRAIADQMAELLIRMAWSNIMRESQDIGAGILDCYGRQVCESDSTPMHCGSLPAYVRGIEERLAGSYAPGDVVLHNHPYHGASHSPDYGIIVPIFFDGRHVAFAGCTGHMLDIGAAHAGFAVDVPDVFAEGKLLNAAKIYEAGRRNEALWNHVLDNVRTPEANAGDLEALISCARYGERKFVELLGRYGLDNRDERGRGVDGLRRGDAPAAPRDGAERHLPRARRPAGGRRQELEHPAQDRHLARGARQRRGDRSQRFQ